MPESDKKSVFVEVKGDYAGLGKAVEEAKPTQTITVKLDKAIAETLQTVAENFKKAASLLEENRELLLATCGRSGKIFDCGLEAK